MLASLSRMTAALIKRNAILDSMFHMLIGLVSLALVEMA
jgi:hypothetical protein